MFVESSFSVLSDVVHLLSISALTWSVHLPRSASRTTPDRFSTCYRSREGFLQQGGDFLQKNAKKKARPPYPLRQRGTCRARPSKRNTKDAPLRVSFFQTQAARPDPVVLLGSKSNCKFSLRRNPTDQAVKPEMIPFLRNHPPIIYSRSQRIANFCRAPGCAGVQP